MIEGTVLAKRYKILKVLGRGGMGQVYQVHDEVADINLAMKVLHTKYSHNDYIVTRFIREVKFIRRLNHPAIVKIYDARRADNILFYTMDYIEGKSLRDWLRKRKQLPWGSVVRVLSLVAHALEHAHQLTIHRDIAPENIMVMADGSVRLLDFGLAKLAEPDPNQAALTVVGMNLGRVQYNAPEQQLNAKEVTPRVDVYSLGVIFYEALAGKMPDGKTLLSELRTDIPKECDDFFQQAVAANADDRIASAPDFLTELARLYELSDAAAQAQDNPKDNTASWSRRLNPMHWFKILFKR
jgi:serine/threonine-protein kinase